MNEQELSLNDMFAHIGDRKEQVAKGILDEREQARASAKEKRLLRMKRDQGLLVGDMDLEAMEKEIDAQLEAVLREQDAAAQTDAASEDIDGPELEAEPSSEGVSDMNMEYEVRQDAANETEKQEPTETLPMEQESDMPSVETTPDTPASEPEADLPVFNLDDFPDADPVNAVPQADVGNETVEAAEPEPEQKEDAAASGQNKGVLFAPVEESVVKMYFDTACDNAGHGAACYTFWTPEGRKVITKTFPAADKREACFFGACELLHTVHGCEMKEVAVFAPAQKSRLLYRNALVLSDGYSPANVKYIAVMRDVGAHACIRFAPDASESQLQTLVGLMAKAVIGLI